MSRLNRDLTPSADNPVISLAISFEIDLLFLRYSITIFSFFDSFIGVLSVFIGVCVFRTGHSLKNKLKEISRFFYFRYRQFIFNLFLTSDLLSIKRFSISIAFGRTPGEVISIMSSKTAILIFAGSVNSTV